MVGYNTVSVTDDAPARCLRCLRPQALCYCSGLPTVASRTRLVVLQHPHERTHPFNTARLAKLCMPNARVHVPTPGFTGTLEARVDVPEDTAVLFPHPQAQDLADLEPAAHPSALVVLDGTWSHAKRLYRENPWLQSLRHVKLRPTAPSNYRIRREPKPEYISTIEAIVEALRIIEPENDRLGELLTAFDRMIDQQIAHRATRRVSRYRSARPRERRAIHRLLYDPRLIVCYAETAPVDPAAPPDVGRELLHWVAARLDTEQTFEAVLCPNHSRPSDEHLRHMGITPAELAAGEPIAAARRRFADFAPDGAPFASWTPTTLAWGHPVLPNPFEQTIVKSSYCNHTQRNAGLLEEVVAREGLTPPRVPCRGRASRRLACTLAVARWLRAQQAAATS